MNGWEDKRTDGYISVSSLYLLCAIFSSILVCRFFYSRLSLRLLCVTEIEIGRCACIRSSPVNGFCSKTSDKSSMRKGT